MAKNRFGTSLWRRQQLLLQRTDWKEYLKNRNKKQSLCNWLICRIFHSFPRVNILFKKTLIWELDTKIDFVVSILAFYFENQSLNPTEVGSFSVNKMLCEKYVNKMFQWIAITIGMSRWKYIFSIAQSIKCELASQKASVEAFQSTAQLNIFSAWR